MKAQTSKISSAFSRAKELKRSQMFAKIRSAEKRAFRKINLRPISKKKISNISISEVWACHPNGANVREKNSSLVNACFKTTKKKFFRSTKMNSRKFETYSRRKKR